MKRAVNESVIIFFSCKWQKDVEKRRIIMTMIYFASRSSLIHLSSVCVGYTRGLCHRRARDRRNPRSFLKLESTSRVWSFPSSHSPDVRLRSSSPPQSTLFSFDRSRSLLPQDLWNNGGTSLDLVKRSVRTYRVSRVAFISRRLLILTRSSVSSHVAFGKKKNARVSCNNKSGNCGVNAQRNIKEIWRNSAM